MSKTMIKQALNVDYYYFMANQADKDTISSAMNLLEPFGEINDVKVYRIHKDTFKENAGVFGNYGRIIANQRYDWFQKQKEGQKKGSDRPQSSGSAVLPPSAQLTGRGISSALTDWADALHEMVGIIDNPHRFNWFAAAEKLRPVVNQLNTASKDLYGVTFIEEPEAKKSKDKKFEEPEVKQQQEISAQRRQDYRRIQTMFSRKLSSYIIDMFQDAFSTQAQDPVVASYTDAFQMGKTYNIFDAAVSDAGVAIKTYEDLYFGWSERDRTMVYIGPESASNINSLIEAQNKLRQIFKNRVKIMSSGGFPQQRAKQSIAWEVSPPPGERQSSQPPGGGGGNVIQLPAPPNQPENLPARVEADIINRLSKIADELEENQLYKEAGEIDDMVKESQSAFAKGFRRFDELMSQRPGIPWSIDAAKAWKSALRQWLNGVVELDNNMQGIIDRAGSKHPKINELKSAHRIIKKMRETIFMYFAPESASGIFKRIDQAISNPRHPVYK